MTCIVDYNILKEGDLYNDTTLASYPVTSSGFSGLYDDNYSLEAYTIPASGVSSVVLSFGEYVDICNVKYYVSPIDLNDISVSYGRDSSSEFFVTSVSSGTHVFADIGDHVGYLQITHSGSTSVDVFQLYVEGVEHEYIGFGTDPASGVDFVFVENSPVGYISSSPQEVPIYNDWNKDLDIHVSVAPSSDEVDDCVYLSTTATGIFYNKNGYGPSQPEFVPVVEDDNSLDIDDLSSFLQEWEFSTGSSSYLETNDGYLTHVIEWVPSSSNQYRSVGPWSYLTTGFLVNTNEFTANQSFTISLDVRFRDATMDNMDTAPAGWAANKFMVGFTNTFPIYDYGTITDETDRSSFDRQGRSFSAVWFGVIDQNDTDKHDLYVGAAANDDDFLSYAAETNFHSIRGYYNDHPIVSYVSMEHLSENVFLESAYYDGTASSVWRNLRLSYDHQTQTAYYYVENVLLATYQYSSVAFMEACRFFFGFHGLGSAEIDMRNLSIEKDKVYRKYYSQSYAAAGRSKDLDGQPPDKMIDGKYQDDHSENAWIGDSDPTTGDYFEIGFGDEYTIDAVSLMRPGLLDNVTISGTWYNSPQYSMNRVFLYFDTGDIRYVDFSYAVPGGLGGWDVSYLTTLSGSIESVVGATSVSGVLETVHDYGSDNRPNAWAIDEIQFYTLSGTTISTNHEEQDWSYQWRNGYVRNLISRGTANVYELQFDDLYNVSTKELARDLVQGYDYDLSNPVFSNSAPTGRMHYAESLFSRIGRGQGVQTEANMEGRQAWIWRYFEETISLSGVLFSFFSNPASGDSYVSMVDRWKLQYLRLGGDPNTSSDWVDIPPLTSAYPGGSEYTDFTQYMVDNNDGEYYTLFLNSMDSNPTLPLPSDLIVRKDRSVYLPTAGVFSSPVCDVYIEFEQSYRTQGMRLVIDDGYIKADRINPAPGYTLYFFVGYSDRPVGSYVSPVFDTGTRLNTERIYVDTEDFEGDTTVLYRSLSTPPTYKHDTAFENWEDLGCPFAGLDEESSFSPFYNGVSSVHYDGTIYFFGENSAQMILYDVTTRKWTYSDTMPTESDGEIVRPDIRTRNNTHVLGDTIICASRSQGGGGVYSSSLLKYYLVENEYLYSGWETLPYQRQPIAVQACGVSDGDNRIFFLSDDGDITVFNLTTGELDTEGRNTVPLHGSTYREYYIPAYYDGRIYVCGGGGNSGTKFDIYDIDADEWTSGPDMPYLLGRAYAFYYGGYIYVLPYYPASLWSPVMKYSLSTEEWVKIVSLSYNYATSILEISGDPPGNAPMSITYCLVGGYLYGMDWIRRDFRRVKLAKEDWVPGSLPNKDEQLWLNSGGEPWVEVTTSGELMPQDRYIQYKVVFESAEGLVPPVLKSATISQPLTLESVPASGTDSIYVKTGITTDATFEAWYSGNDNFWDPSIIYTISDDGYDFFNSTAAITDTVSSGITHDYGYVDAYVVKDTSGYEMWSTFAEIEETEYRWGSIFRATSINGYDWTTASFVIGTNSEGTYDTDHVYGACVVKDVTYEMWYTGEDSSSVPRILYADSSDGVTWANFILSQDKATTRLEPDADYNGALHPSVIKIDGVYHMWYEGLDQDYTSRIIYCSSVDGVTWGNHQIVLTHEDVPQNDVVGVGDPCVVFDLDTFYIWFSGISPVSERVYHAVSAGGIVWGGVSAMFAKNHHGENDLNYIRSF